MRRTKVTQTYPRSSRAVKWVGSSVGTGSRHMPTKTSSQACQARMSSHQLNVERTTLARIKTSKRLSPFSTWSISRHRSNTTLTCASMSGWTTTSRWPSSHSRATNCHILTNKALVSFRKNLKRRCQWAVQSSAASPLQWQQPIARNHPSNRFPFKIKESLKVKQSMTTLI